MTYQGWTVTAVRFRRSRGWGPDQSVVEMPCKKFPEGFTLATPARALRADGDGVTTVVRGAIELPSRLEPAGLLELVEVQGTVTYRFPPVLLWIRGVERVLDDVSGEVSMIRVTLVDERELWHLGMARRSSWNRVLADGQVADPQSVGTRKQIAAALVQDLFRAPTMSAAPERWATQSGPIEFPAFCAPAVALRALIEDGGCGPIEPCLRLDGTVAFHLPGDGKVAFAANGKGANSEAVPDGHILWEDGSGDGYTQEITYAPRWVVVRGQVRVATVRLRCEPVLVLPNGKVLPLTEETVRELTQGLWGLDGLTKFVLMPSAYQEDARLPPGVGRLLAGQAWRLWQIEGMRDDTPPEKRNRHIPPILDRAEIGPGGRRLPPLVERVGFRVVHEAFGGATGLAKAELDALAEIERTSDVARQVAQTRVRPNPLTDPGGAEFFTQRMTLEQVLGADRLEKLSKAGLDVGKLQEQVSEARRIEGLRELDGSVATARSGAYDDLYRARDEATGGTSATGWDLAKKVAAFEKEARENTTRLDRFAARGLGDTEDALLQESAASPELAGSRAALEAAADAAISSAAKATRTQIREAGLGGRRREEPRPVIVHLNFPLEVDVEASVYSEEQGIVQTSGLAGTLKPEGAYALETAEFTPGEVWVTFGAVVRPRSGDGPATTQNRADGAVLGPLADAVTYFVRAFERGAAGGDPAPVKVTDVPQGEGLVVLREDLPPELVPLTGDGNVAALEREALAVARGIFDTPPAVAAVQLVFGRAWPINPDGLVESVEIVSFSDPAEGTGFKTTVRCGYRAQAEASVGTTRVRPPRPRDVQDGARREGLTP